MIFDSLAELESYVRGVMDKCAGICAEEMLEIMREEIENAYNSYSPSMYSRTGDLLNTPQIIQADSSGMTTEFVDNGGWYSLVGRTAGQHFFALEGLEAGTSWGRGATNIYSFSAVKCYSNIPDKYKKCLISFGIPIQ
jgi:hypothetical protein